MKEKIQKWYNLKLWDSKMIYKAVEKGILSEKEYQDIVNQGGNLK